MKKVALIFSISILVTFLAFELTKQWEENKRQKEFSIRAEAHTAAIRTGLKNIARQLEDMRFLIEFNINNKTNSQDSPEKFVRLLTPIITHEPAIIDIAWAIPIDNNKAQIIYSWKNESDIEQYQINPTLAPITAYFVKEPNQKEYLQLIAPVTNEINAIDSATILKGNTIAWLISEWDILTLIEDSLKYTPVSSQDIKISTINDEKINILYFHPSRSRTPEDLDVHTNITHIDTFPFLGLNIQVEYEAAPRFLKDFPIVMAWQTLLHWLLISLFLTLYLYRRERKKLKFRRIIDNLQDVYYQMDMDGIIQMVSPSIVSFGYTKDEIVGTSFSNYLINPEEFNKIFACLSDSSDGRLQNHHIQIKHQTGHNLWISLNAKYIYNNSNQTVGVEGTLNDYTKAKENQDKMQQADKLENLGLMAAGIAHNFNNILFVIMGNASVAKFSAQKNPETIKHLDAIEEASEKAAAICKQILAYTGQGKCITQSLSVSQTIQEVSQLLKASFSNLAEVEFKLQDNIPSIQNADPSQIQQMVIDLVHNAAESYGEEFGTVFVKTGKRQLSTTDLKHCLDHEHLKEGQYIYIQVVDKGCGIPKEELTHIFEPFVTTKFTGRGLGLSAVRGIVRSHHGTIQLKSKKNKGTSITIFFPVDNEV